MSLPSRVLKYGVHGGITYAAFNYLSNGASGVTLFGQNVPMIVAGLGVGVATSMLNDAAHSFIIPYLPQDEKLKSIEGTAVSLGSGAASMLGFSYLANQTLLSNPGVAQLAILGAASEVASQWTYQQLAGWVGISQQDVILQ